jgi:hypothetical protein
MSHGRVNFESERLFNLKLNPLNCNSQQLSAITQNVDPDSNLTGNVLNCDFCTGCSLNAVLCNILSANCLSLMHLNHRLEELFVSLNYVFFSEQQCPVLSAWSITADLTLVLHLVFIIEKCLECIWWADVVLIICAHCSGCRICWDSGFDSSFIFFVSCCSFLQLSQISC